MYIEVKEYELTIDEQEAWIFIYGLHSSIKSTIKHSTHHNGFDTIVSNHEKEINMLKQLCIKVGRPEIYEQYISEVKDEIDILMKEKGDKQ